MNKKVTTEDFIKKAIVVHGNKYDYSKVNYISAKNKIIIICKKDNNEFLQSPDKHINKAQGCPKCGFILIRLSKIKTQIEFIEKAIKVHGNKYDYSKTTYKGISEKIIIICNEHKEFTQTPNNHLFGRGCPECADKNMTTAKFIEKAKKIHGNKYDYSKSNYINSVEKIIIICKDHEFNQAPSNHLQGNGCPQCSGNKKITTEEFIEKANTVHNNKYDYSKVNYININDKVLIICKKDNYDFLQSPNNHLNGSGCPECSNVKKLTTKTFIEKAVKIHGNKYDYSLVDYKNINIKINIICSKHKVFTQTPNVHLAGTGCGKCANKNVTTEEFIEKAIKIHSNKYDYSKVYYKKSDEKIIIICKDHGEFLQTPNNHLNYKGCSICKKSIDELITFNLLQKLNINFKTQYKLKLLHNATDNYSYVDFYLPDYNLFIEINGQQHYIPTYFNSKMTKEQINENLKKQQIRDKNLDNYCNINNIKFLKIDSRRISRKKLIKYLEEYFYNIKAL